MANVVGASSTPLRLDAREYRLFKSLDAQNKEQVIVGDLLECLREVPP